MKKLTQMYKGYMFHPILYKTVTRTSIVAVLMLLWDRYVSDGYFTMWQAPGLLLGTCARMPTTSRFCVSSIPSPPYRSPVTMPTMTSGSPSTRLESILQKIRSSGSSSSKETIFSSA